MVYWILSAILAIWTALDANKRGHNAMVWGVLAFIAWQLVIPIYLVKRRLNAGETRKGGSGWIFTKHLAILWTLSTLVTATTGYINATVLIDAATSQTEADFLAIGRQAALTLELLLWVFPVVIALIVGLIMRRQRTIEVGPKEAGQVA